MLAHQELPAALFCQTVASCGGKQGRALRGRSGGGVGGGSCNPGIHLPDCSASDQLDVLAAPHPGQGASTAPNMRALSLLLLLLAQCATPSLALRLPRKHGRGARGGGRGAPTAAVRPAAFPARTARQRLMMVTPFDLLSIWAHPLRCRVGCRTPAAGGARRRRPYPAERHAGGRAAADQQPERQRCALGRPGGAWK